MEGTVIGPGPYRATKLVSCFFCSTDLAMAVTFKEFAVKAFALYMFLYFLYLSRPICLHPT